MAIGPYEARLSERERRQLQALEEEADRYLRGIGKADTASIGCTLDPQAFPLGSISRAVMDALAERYRAAGWRQVEVGIAGSNYSARFHR